jgi:Na+-transporting methylmalonyl-CoA/oxaloacetate decarboxylase gamma subunit
MRVVFGVLSLLVVVAIVGILAKKQLGAVAPAAAPAVATPAGTPPVPTGTPKQQIQQVQQAVEGALQQARPMPDDTK